MDGDADFDFTNENVSDQFPFGQLEPMCQGAEARIYKTVFLGRPAVVKERFAKAYRHAELDEKLRRDRLKMEIRSIIKCQQFGIPVPPLYHVDMIECRTISGYIQDSVTVRQYICDVQKSCSDNVVVETLTPLAAEIGRLLAILHANHIIHGDLTTSNMLLKEPFEQAQVVLIDFGLSYIEPSAEDKSVDLYVLEKAFLSTHPNTDIVFQAILDSYAKHSQPSSCKKVMTKLDDVRTRGRKRVMIG